MMVSDLPFLIFDVMRCYVIVKFKSILLWCDHSSIDVIWCIILHTHHPTLTIHRPSIWYDEQWFMFDAFSHLLLLLTHLLHFTLLCFTLLYFAFYFLFFFQSSYSSMWWEKEDDEQQENDETNDTDDRDDVVME